MFCTCIYFIVVVVLELCVNRITHNRLQVSSVILVLVLVWSVVLFGF
jgi:hypothetical protein